MSERVLNVFLDISIDDLTKQNKEALNSFIHTIGDIDSKENINIYRIRDLGYVPDDDFHEEYLFNKVRIINSLIKKMEVWESEDKLESENPKYYKWEFAYATKISPFKNILGYMAYLFFHFDQYSFLVTLKNYHGGNIYTIIDYEKLTTSIESYWYQIAFSNPFTNFDKSFYSWYSNLVQPRKYDHNYKHDLYPIDRLNPTNHKKELDRLLIIYLGKYQKSMSERRGNQQKFESPLFCSEDKAIRLLQSAIGDPNRELFNYDSETKLFIEYKTHPNTPNLYHGYHRLDRDIFLSEVESNHSLDTRRQLEQREKLGNTE